MSSNSIGSDTTRRKYLWISRSVGTLVSVTSVAVFLCMVFARAVFIRFYFYQEIMLPQCTRVVASSWYFVLLAAVSISLVIVGVLAFFRLRSAEIQIVLLCVQAILTALMFAAMAQPLYVPIVFLR